MLHFVIIMNFEYINLSDIAYEQIAGKFWNGCYGVFRVVMMKDCGLKWIKIMCRLWKGFVLLVC